MASRAISLVEKTAPAFSVPERWRKPLWVGLAVLNFVLIAKLLSWPDWRGANDWRLWTLLGPDPYTPLFDAAGLPMPYRYSPVAAWVLTPLAIAVGPVGFIVGHFLALLTLPRKVGLIVALSFPFWFDLLWGNVFTLTFVAAWWAMKGNRWGVVAFLTLTLLMPRPVQLPLLAWLLWREPWVRWPFVGIFLGHAALVLLSGHASEWLAILTSASGYEANMAYNLGPSRLFGSAWLVVGMPLAVYLFRKHPEWAGLALSPYLLGQYWLMALSRTR